MKDEEPGIEQGIATPATKDRTPEIPGKYPAALPGNGQPPPLERAPLAYENPAFLNCADGRLIRIVAEYLEPLARFRREQIQDTVVFFGSAPVRGREEGGSALGVVGNTGSRPPAPR